MYMYLCECVYNELHLSTFHIYTSLQQFQFYQDDMLIISSLTSQLKSDVLFPELLMPRNIWTPLGKNKICRSP